MNSSHKGKSQSIDPFEHSLDTFCHTLIEEMKPFYHSDLQPFNSFAGYVKDKLKDQVSHFKNSFVNGYKLVFEHIVAKKQSPEEQEKYRIPSELWENLQNASESSKENETLQEVVGYTEEMMAEIDALAQSFYQNAENEKSADLFIFLTALNPYTGWFWQGLGQSLQALHRSDEALYAYTLALNCMPYEIKRYRDAARCCLTKNDYEGALNILQYGLELYHGSTIKEQLQGFKHKLKAMIAYIEKLKRGDHQ